MKAILEERQRLARDLHDSVTQSLYGLTLFTEASREWAAAGDLQRVEGQLARIAETAGQALKEMRLLVYELRPFDLHNEGIVAALNRRLDAVERRAGVDAHLRADIQDDLSSVVEETLFRIAQQALANALKHAHASRVGVSLRAREGRAELEVVDDGVGFELEAVRGQGGMGLTSMQERMENVGGVFAVATAPGKGTRVRAEMPIPARTVDRARIG
jgi:signal transduction histidine kinase